MKRILWGSLLIFLLAACGTSSNPEVPQTTNTFKFSVDPAAQSVKFAAVPTGVFNAQAEDGSRVLVPGTDLSLESSTFTFLPGNVLAIDAVFKNVSDQTFTNLSFSRAASSNNIVSSTEPGVVARLDPGESTGPLRFTVQHKGQPFTYEVEATATVGETGGADCTDPVNIPDRDLREGIRIQLQISVGDEITCADMEKLTELDFRELQFDIDPENPELVDVSNLEGLQFAVNLALLRISVTGDNKDLLQPLSGLTSLTNLAIGLSNSRQDDIDIPEEFENFYDFSYLGSLINLTDLSIFAYQTDYSWINSLTKLTTLNLGGNELIKDLTPFSTLTNLTNFNLSRNSVSDIGPLVSNPGIGEGDDRLDLDQNCLDVTPGSEDLADVNTLENRNPDVQNIFLGTQKKDAFCGRTPDSGADLNLFVNAFKRGDDGFGTVDTVQVGDVVEFNVNIDNNGPDTASDIVVTVDVDNAAGLELFVSEGDVSANCDTVLDGPETYKLVCTLTEALPAGGDVGPDPRFFLGFAAEADKTGTMTARFEVSSKTTTDFDLSNNRDVKEISILPENSGEECNNPVSIPDDILRQSIRDALNKPEGDIICADLASLTELVSRIEFFPEIEPISNLEGIQFAKNLETLDFFVPCCEIASGYFEPLSGLTNLTTLKIFNSRDFKEDDYDDLDFSPLSGLFNLTVLSLPETQVSNIDFLSNLTNLSTLDLSDNLIDDYSPLSGLTALKELDLSADRLFFEFSGIDDIGFLSGLTALTDLNLSDNDISDLSPLSGLTQLVELDLSSNLVTDISPLVMNEGVGDGSDTLILGRNCLDTSSGSQALGDIETIENRNPNVQNVYAGFQREGEKAAKCG